jgi:hypothetical protein
MSNLSIRLLSLFAAMAESKENFGGSQNHPGLPRNHPKLRHVSDTRIREQCQDTRRYTEMFCDQRHN